MKYIVIVLLFVFSVFGRIVDSPVYMNVSGESFSGETDGEIRVYESSTSAEPLWIGMAGPELPRLYFVNGTPVNLDQLIPVVYQEQEYLWVVITAEGVMNTAERIRLLGTGAARTPLSRAVDSPGEITETLDDDLILGVPGDELIVESDRAGFGDSSPNERVTVAGAVSMQEMSSTPATTAGYGKVYVEDATGNLMYIDEAGTITDLTETHSDSNAVYSVSSSADRTGRIGHMMFVPSDATEITESDPANNDTIYIVHKREGLEDCSGAPPQPDLIDGITPICSGEPGTSYGVAPTPGASYYRWTLPVGATVSDGFGTNIIHAILGDNDGDICVKAVNACGESPSRCFAVTINRPTAPGVIAGDPLVCDDTTGLTYSIDAVPEATSYIWTVPAGAIITSGSSTNEITVSFGTIDGEICVQTENSCGRSEPRCMSITMTETPITPGEITGSSSLCEYTSSTYYISSVTEATNYVWTVPSGASITSGDGTTTIDILFGNTSGNVTVAAQSICGTSPSRTKAVTVVNPPATPGTITGNAVVPPSASDQSYSISAVTGASSYSWSVTGDASIDGSSTGTSILVDFGASAGTTVDVCVNASNSCGTSADNCKTVTIAAPSGSSTFNYTGSQQTFTVPAGVFSIDIECWGAQGGSGANGGYAKGTYSSTPGSNLYVYVGGQGGYNGGGTGTISGRNGGGMSDVRAGGTAVANQIIVAGGGGGGGDNTPAGTGGGGSSCANGAGGGYGRGWSGYNGTAGTCTVGGSGGTGNVGGGGGGGGGLTSGGAGGRCDAYSSSYWATAGTRGQGGSWVMHYCSTCQGGGGGGGYYGGGGAATGCCSGGSGGGGSSWAHSSLTALSFSAGVRSGNGQVIISW